MLVQQKLKSNPLLQYGRWSNSYNGTGNYIKNQNSNTPQTVTQLEKAAFPAVINVNQINFFEDEEERPTYVLYKENDKKSDLPLTSDLLSNVNYDAPPAALRLFSGPLANALRA